MAYNRRSSRKGIYRKPWPIRSRKRWIGTVVASAPVSVTPITGTLVLTGYAPSVLTPRLVTPTTGTLVLTGYAPTVTAGSAVSVTPTTGTLVLTGYAPTVTVSSSTPIRRVVVRPPLRRLVIGGVTFGEAYTDPARVIMHPRVAAWVYATAYTDFGGTVLRTSEPASARMLARLAGAAWDTGEFSASAILVDEDVEALVLMGVF